MAATQLSVN